MKQILLRAAKHPFEVASSVATLKQNTIATNVGNLLFSDAVFKHLSTSKTEVHTNGPKLNGDPKDADRINEQYDAFVVPLANAFRPSFSTELVQMTRLIERLSIPVVVPGVGAQTGPEGRLERLTPIKEEVTAFIRAVLDRSASIGVRGEVTAEYLADLGFKDHTEIIGCPAMFSNGPGFRVEKRIESLEPDTAIALSYSPSSPTLSVFPRMVERMLSDYHNITYFPQNTEDLKMLYWGDTSRQSGLPVKASSRKLANPVLKRARAVFPLDPEPWLNGLGKCDFAVGTRIHGNMAAILAGTPAYVMGHDSRTIELAKYLGIPYHDVSKLHDGVNIDDLYRKLDYAEFNAGYDERYENYTNFLAKNDLDNCFDHGDGGAEFDRRKRESGFPQLVESWTDTGDTEVAERIAWLNERVAATERLEKRVGKLEAELKRRTQRTARATNRIGGVWGGDLGGRIARRVKKVLPSQRLC